jgi:hypothetical protein
MPMGQSLQVERVTRDLSKLSEKELNEIVKRDSPELLELLNDFLQNSKDLRDKLVPTLEKLQDAETSKGLSFLQMKLRRAI